MNNKWTRAAIPALLLHCSIGTVYCWSVFSQEISDRIGFSKPAVEWAFSFAIFFLGMSAAFLGGIVEKNIHLSSLIATICFTVGMLGTGFFIWYGGTDAGHGNPLTLIKTLMLWFEDKKGLATGLAVAGFGAAKAIASPIMQSLLHAFGEDKKGYLIGVYMMFFILGGVYFVMMFVGHRLLKKPDGWVEPTKKEKGQGVWATIKSKPITNYIGIWLMFYINITCGLAIISQEKMIVKIIGLGAVVGIISSISAIFNAGGRLGFSAWADYMKDRNTIYKIIFSLSILFTGLVILTNGIKNGAGNVLLIAIVLGLIFVVNAGYGGGFSNVPTLLHDHYGMGNISAIHGITLSAWAFAGLSGNQLASWIVTHTGTKQAEGNAVGYQYVLYATIVLYAIALLLSIFFVRKSGKAAKAVESK